MKKAWAEIQRLHDAGARHRKGKRLCDFTETQILSHAAEEIVELAASPDDAEELADVFGCIIHYAIMKGWNRKMIEGLILAKLKDRVHE